MSDIYTAVVDSLKVLDPNRPIREADIAQNNAHGSASDAKQLLLPDVGVDSDKGIYRKYLSKLVFLSTVPLP